jgi:hypothetical protein
MTTYRLPKYQARLRHDCQRQHRKMGIGTQETGIGTQAWVVLTLTDFSHMVHDCAAGLAKNAIDYADTYLL